MDVQAGTTYTVTTLSDVTDADDGVLSLREAVDLANASGDGSPDTIIFQSGLTGSVRLGGTLFITDDVTIDGDTNGDSRADIIITGDANGDDTVVNGVTVIHGADYTATASDNSRLIYSSANILTLDSLTLTGGRHGADGGAVNSTGNVTLNDTTVAGNFSAAGGGGVTANNIEATNSTFSDNQASYGGGLYAGSSISLTNSTVSGNSSARDGGGILSLNTVSLTSSTVAFNSADMNGGGISADHLSMFNSTVTGNRAALTSGGMLVSTVTLTNSILLGNSAPDYADMMYYQYLDFFGGNVLFDHVWSGYSTTVNAVASEIFRDVVDIGGGVMAGVLSDNGGPVRTVALNTAITNPALDASNSSAPATDATGHVRVDVAEIDNINGGAADLGAAEGVVQPLSAVTGTLTAAELAVNASAVGQVSATGGSGSLAFSLTDDANGRFAIDSEGNVTVADGLLLDYEQNASHDIKIKVEDQNGGSNETTLTVTITDVSPENITGDSRANFFMGGAGNDTMSGGGGNDTLSGSLGDDTYIDPVGDTIDEGKASGIDLVRSSASFTLDAIAYVENLTLTGSANIGGAGNGGANVLTGNDGNNRLSGLGGADTLIGGIGNDVYVNPTGATIREFANQGADTVESSQTFSLSGVQHVENLTLTGSANANALGNSYDNILTGNAGANRFRGGGGADTMIGGAGNDTYIDPTGATITEAVNGGTDTVESSTTFSISGRFQVENLILTGTGNINATGNSYANVLTGTSGDNRLRGQEGSDTLDGGAGNDIFVYGTVVDSTGSSRDHILSINLNQDKFDFHIVPASIAAAVTTGALNEASFNTDLAAAIGTAQLGAGSAVLFHADAGDLSSAGQHFLIVDANNTAGYQAGQDYVVQLSNVTGTLTLDDFV